MARESLDVLTLVFANRQYQILRTEFQNMGIAGVSERAAKLLDIDSPTVDWAGLVKALGVPAIGGSTLPLSSILVWGLKDWEKLRYALAPRSPVLRHSRFR
jgi:hypothetical protein